ncbi:MAG TPA: radical SAM protein [Blastocatellia bacterium]|nr:radical SAM protein [Blastocatellia bacterium]
MEMNEKNVLLINPPYFEHVFGKSAIRGAVAPGTIILSLAAVAPAVRQSGFNVRLIDLNIDPDPKGRFIREMLEFRPAHVALTFTTSVYHIAKEYAAIARSMSPDVRLVCGGHHATLMPEEVLSETEFDVVVRGEGDFTLAELVSGKCYRDIPGITFKEDGKFVATQSRPMIFDLDQIPLPALDLYDVPRYRHPRFMARRNPVAYMETSRGCYGACIFCNARRTKLRRKSVNRVIEEMKYVLSLGFREIHLADDLFTADLKRVKEICRAIINNRIDISWYPRAGIRVDHVDKELFDLMKRAGVWSVPFGIESGNEDILKRIGKNITLDQVRNAVRLAKSVGLTTEGYFMVGHPDETEETMKQTIKFSTSIGLDYAKFTINTPLPGTPLFDEWERAGVIKTRDWSKYNFHTPPAELYDHPNLDWKTIDQYYKLGMKRFYFRPSYILKRGLKDLFSGQLLPNLKVLVRSLPNWRPAGKVTRATG